MKTFRRELIPILKTQFLNIGVVGGGLSEPELQILQDNHDLEIKFFGIEGAKENCIYLDLNSHGKGISEFANSYDLVICSQVLEHVWSLDRAFQHLETLVKPGGLLWISCPASNFLHASPEYFSAGYMPEVLENFCKRNNLTPISQGTLGSQRLYLSRHALFTWLGERDYKWPIFAYFPIAENYARKFLYQFSSLPIRIALTLASKELSTDPKYAVETWGIFQKPVE